MQALARQAGVIDHSLARKDPVVDISYQTNLFDNKIAATANCYRDERKEVSGATPLPPRSFDHSYLPVPEPPSFSGLCIKRDQIFVETARRNPVSRLYQAPVSPCGLLGQLCGSDSTATCHISDDFGSAPRWRGRCRTYLLGGGEGDECVHP